MSTSPRLSLGSGPSTTVITLGGPGARAALVSRNVPAYIEALFACWWAGLTAVPVNAKLHPRELAFVLSDSGARWAFVDAAWHAAIGAASPSIEVVELGSSTYAKL